MSTYKLTYFEARGVAETTRLLMALTGTKYQDERIPREKWDAEQKKKYPFRQLPVLEVDGVQICSSRAIEKLIAKRTGLYGSNDMEEARIDMVVGCLDDMVKPIFEILFSDGVDQSKKTESKEKYVNETAPVHIECLNEMINSDGFVIGEKISYADVAIFYGMTFPGIILGDKKLEELLDVCGGNIKKLRENVAKDPKIAEWIKCRPQTEY